MMKIVKLLILVALAAAVINDSGRYLTARYDLGHVTTDAATVSAEAVKAHGSHRTASWRAGETIAEKSGATVYGFDIVKNESVHVWTRSDVPGTWVLQHVAALLEQKPWQTPLQIEDEATASIP
jgi:hypothetical protein